MKILFTAVLMLGLSSCATKISGALMDTTGSPVNHQNGKVNITRLDTSSSDSFQETIAIDQDGTFESVAEIKPGKYLVEALVPGFKATSVRVEVKQSEELKMTLSPIPTVQKSTIRTNMDIEAGRGSGSANINPPSL